MFFVLQTTMKPKKYITFSDTVKYYFEPDHLIYDLRQSRISLYLQHQTDKMRYERLLSPILTQEHRNKIRIIINQLFL